MAHEHERIAQASCARVALGIEALLIERIQDDRDLLPGRAALDEALSHLLRAGDDRVGEADAHLLQEHQESNENVIRLQLVFGDEVLGHAFVQVEKDPRAEEARHDGREHEPVGQRVDLDDVVPAAQVQRRGEYGRQDLEGYELEQVAPESGSPSRDREAVDRESAPSLETRLAGQGGADHVHLVAGAQERLHLAGDPGVDREVPRADETDPRH